MTNSREFYKSLTDADLAFNLSEMKEKAADLRQTIWAFEDELRDRLITRNATVILAGDYRIKSSVKREVIWDQEALGRAKYVAHEEGREVEFYKAFPPVFDCSVRNLNALLKLGGDTAKAVEAARAEVKEKLEIKVEAKNA